MFLQTFRHVHVQRSFVVILEKAHKGALIVGFQA